MTFIRFLSYAFVCHLLFSVGKINEQGIEIGYDRFYDSSFFLPFTLSSQIENFDSMTSERVLGTPTVRGAKCRLYLQFAQPTTYVIRWKRRPIVISNKANRHKSRAPSPQWQTHRPTDKPADRVAYRVAWTQLKSYQISLLSFHFLTHFRVSIIYRQPRYLAIDAERKAFRNVDLDQ